MPEVKEAPRPKTENGPTQTKDVATRTAGTPAVWTNPFTMMRRFAREMDHLFEDFGFGPRMHIPRLLTRGHEALRRGAGLVPAEWSPQVDVLTREGEFVVR